MKKQITISLIFSTFLLLLVGCSGVKKVAFETPVNTTSKPIQNQVKKTYTINELGIYASNEFDGARLNGFEKLNDTTAIVFISPENGPINNSPYYAFRAWSNTQKSFYFKFKYPKGYKHRYIPKIKKGNNIAFITNFVFYFFHFS